MAYKIVFTKQSFKDIDKLNETIKIQLKKKFEYFSSLDDVKAVAKKLQNTDIGEYRLRMGDYRVIFDLDKHKIVVLRVVHRKDVYR